jgi:hypothetical protein
VQAATIGPLPGRPLVQRAPHRRSRFRVTPRTTPTLNGKKILFAPWQIATGSVPHGRSLPRKSPFLTSCIPNRAKRDIVKKMGLPPAY